MSEFYGSIGFVIKEAAKEQVWANIHDVHDIDSIKRHLASAHTHVNDMRSDATLGYLWSYDTRDMKCEIMSSLKVLMRYLNKNDYLFIRIGINPTDVECGGTYYNNPLNLKLDIVFGPDEIASA